MKIYYGKNKKKAEKISFQELLIQKLAEAGYKMDNGAWSNENYSWVGIVQESEKPSQVVINISFDTKEDVINGIAAFETPIVTKPDEDRSKQII